MNWQPIELAPKDGTLVIGALIRDGVVWRVFEMAFADFGAWYGKNGDFVPTPTHFIKMPGIGQ